MELGTTTKKDLTSVFLSSLGPRTSVPESYSSAPGEAAPPSSLASGTSAPASASAAPLPAAPSPAGGSRTLTDAFLGSSSTPKGPVPSANHSQLSLPPLYPPHSTLITRSRNDSAIARAGA